MVMRSAMVLIALLAAALLALGGAAAWLVGTTAGAEWLLAQANRLGAVRIDARIDGSLWGGLDLRQIEVRWAGGQAASESLLLAWQPRALLAGRLAVDSLELGRTRVVFHPAAGEPPSAPTRHSAFELPELWTALPLWLRGVRAEIDDFSVVELGLAGEGGEPLVLGELRGLLRLNGGLLQAETLHVRLPCGTWDGSVSLDLSARRVATDLLWRGKLHVADWDGVRARVALDERFSGTLRAEALAGPTERLALQADAALTLAGVELTNFTAQRSRAADRIAGTVRIDWGGTFRLDGDLRVTHLNLAAEAGWPTDLSGTVRAELTTRGYAGEVDLESFRPDLERGRLAATVVGSWGGLSLDELRGEWLGGRVAGALRLDWQEGFHLDGELQGSGIKPEVLVPELTGELQLAGRGGLQVTPAGELSAHWDVDLARSRLQNRPLEGRVAGRWQDDELILEAFDLKGDGLHAKGRGRLHERIDLELQVADLSRLAGRWQGALAGSGWLARRHGEWIGAGRGGLQGLQLGEIRAGAGQFDVEYAGAQENSRVQLMLSSLELPQGALNEVAVFGSGRLAEHLLRVRLSWQSGGATGRFAGGWEAEEWSGRVLELQGREEQIGSWELIAPARLTVAREHIDLQRLQLVGDLGGLVDLDAAFFYQPLAGRLQASWQDVPLGFLDPWLGGPSLKGAATGEMELGIARDGSLELAVDLFSAPVLIWGGRTLSLGASQANLAWDAGGLAATAELHLGRDGTVRLSCESEEPGRFVLPERGRLTADWEQLDITQLAPWLPEELSLEGSWQGRLAGRWQRDALLELDGSSWISAGELQWHDEDGIIHLPVQQAELAGSWRTGWAEGALTLVLADHGRIEGRFRLPFLTDQEEAPLHAEGRFDLDELGLLALLMPGVTNETRGELRGELRLAGTWQQPELYGRFSLRGASAEVPALGLKLRDAELEGRFDKNVMHLDRLRLTSGDGRLEGSGGLQLSGWRLESWNLTLRGDNVRFVHLPEITLEASPDLEFSGSPELLRVRGKVEVPTLLISEVPKAKIVEPSEDVILADVPPETPIRVFEKLDVDLAVTLGKHVTVKARGLDTRLTGAVDVLTDERGIFIGRGEIRVPEGAVAQGHYAAYGLKLPITRGRAIFGGGLIQEPVLDVLAERSVGEVKAGVQITGTPRRPVVKLVSDPALPDTEILSYLVLGRPLGTGGGQNDSLLLAASALLSQGESAALQEKIKRQIGIDVLEVQSGSEGVQGSMVAVGKYLTPDLYLSFGQSLFTPENVAKLRYQFGKNWELESQLGTVSGADLSYRLEFR